MTWLTKNARNAKTMSTEKALFAQYVQCGATNSCKKLSAQDVKLYEQGLDYTCKACQATANNAIRGGSHDQDATLQPQMNMHQPWPTPFPTAPYMPSNSNRMETPCHDIAVYSSHHM